MANSATSTLQDEVAELKKTIKKQAAIITELQDKVKELTSKLTDDRELIDDWIAAGSSF